MLFVKNRKLKISRRKQAYFWHRMRQGVFWNSRLGTEAINVMSHPDKICWSSCFLILDAPFKKIRIYTYLMTRWQLAQRRWHRTWISAHSTPKAANAVISALCTRLSRAYGNQMEPLSWKNAVMLADVHVFVCVATTGGDCAGSEHSGAFRGKICGQILLRDLFKGSRSLAESKSHKFRHMYKPYMQMCICISTHSVSECPLRGKYMNSCHYWFKKDPLHMQHVVDQINSIIFH